MSTFQQHVSLLCKVYWSSPHVRCAKHVRPIGSVPYCCIPNLSMDGYFFVLSKFAGSVSRPCSTAPSFTFVKVTYFAATQL